MNWAIKCEGISKLYRIGRTNATASELINAKLRKVTRVFGKQTRSQSPVLPPHEGAHLVIDPSQMEKAPPNHFWALRDIDLNITQGERLGVIGSNGCGKSTLLKLLSRITSPTHGQFRFRGRLISLLEIGTGFHGELTGRENIFLNGSIMGMNPGEIRRRLDEIIEFSELGEMIDTPVKRYSSGMYIRLAFSVAAHLESELLLLDEVLAVGDAAFQKKCSDKMLEVAGQGRTLVLVSHNMDAINRICNRVIHMAHGRIVEDSSSRPDSTMVASGVASSSVNEVTRSYVRSGSQLVPEIKWQAEHAPVYGGCIRLNSVCVRKITGSVTSSFAVTEPIVVEINFDILEERFPVNVHIHLKDLAGHYILVSMDNRDAPQGAQSKRGQYFSCCTIPAPLLNSGDFRIDVEFWPGKLLEERLIRSSVVSFSVYDDLSPDGIRGNWPNEWPPSLLRPQLKWRIEHRPLS